MRTSLATGLLGFACLLASPVRGDELSAWHAVSRLQARSHGPSLRRRLAEDGKEEVSDSLQLSFKADGRDYSFDLRRTEIFAPNAKVRVNGRGVSSDISAPNIPAYTGSHADGWVSCVLGARGEVRAIIRDGDETLILDPSRLHTLVGDGSAKTASAYSSSSSGQAAWAQAQSAATTVLFRMSEVPDDGATCTEMPSPVKGGGRRRMSEDHHHPSAKPSHTHSQHHPSANPSNTHGQSFSHDHSIHPVRRKLGSLPSGPAPYGRMENCPTATVVLPMGLIVDHALLQVSGR
ncbi:hypothetical protein T492DRAFT_1128406 [Pavlovales sp. CCMP2436]|nr:hypothetical protein T492DRAFT_1128406 [Pavlovales sp. CCMP2436]